MWNIYVCAAGCGNGTYGADCMQPALLHTVGSLCDTSVWITPCVTSGLTAELASEFTTSVSIACL